MVKINGKIADFLYWINLRRGRSKEGIRKPFSVGKKS